MSRAGGEPIYTIGEPCVGRQRLCGKTQPPTGGRKEERKTNREVVGIWGRGQEGPTGVSPKDCKKCHLGRQRWHVCHCDTRDLIGPRGFVFRKD